MVHSVNRFGKSAGWTLLELMIVLTILGVLTSLAYSSYVDQVRKARRADAASTLLEGAQVLERCFTRYNAYNDSNCPNPAGTSGDGHYTISVTRDANTYTLTAAPATGSDETKDACGSYTLDHLGNKTPTPSKLKCWGSLSNS